MKKFLILFLFLARFAVAETIDWKTWLIQYYSIPADAKITDFRWWPDQSGNPYRFKISWETQSEPGHYHQHSRTFDNKGDGVTVLQSDD
jgi:hypothetical protein